MSVTLAVMRFYAMMGRRERPCLLQGSLAPAFGPILPIALGGLSSPEGLVFGPDGHLYITGSRSGSGSDAIAVRYDGRTGAFLNIFVDASTIPDAAKSGGLSDPRGLVFGPDGHLYVTSSVEAFGGGTNAIFAAMMGAPAFSSMPLSLRRVVGCPIPGGWCLARMGTSMSLALAAMRFCAMMGIPGLSSDDFVPQGRGGLDVPRGLVFGPDGHLYVSSAGSNEILRYDGRTGAFLNDFVPQGRGGLDAPEGWCLVSMAAYVTSAGTDKILRYDGRTGAFLNDFVPQGRGGLDAPRGLVFGLDGQPSMSLAPVFMRSYAMMGGRGHPCPL